MFGGQGASRIARTKKRHIGLRERTNLFGFKKRNGQMWDFFGGFNLHRIAVDQITKGTINRIVFVLKSKYF